MEIIRPYLLKDLLKDILDDKEDDINYYVDGIKEDYKFIKKKFPKNPKKPKRIAYTEYVKKVFNLSFGSHPDLDKFDDVKERKIVKNLLSEIVSNVEKAEKMTKTTRINNNDSKTINDQVTNFIITSKSM